MALNRTNLSQQIPPEYDRGVFARIVRTLDLENARLTAFAGTATWNPDNVLNGSYTSTTVSVPGVRAGALASVRVFAPYTLSGMQASGYVSADNTVTITLYNNTGGAVNLGSGTWGVVVENFVQTE